MALRKLPLAVASVVALTLVSSFSAWSANVHPGLPEVKRVYLLPMSGGLDQYLANRLTKAGRFEVVTDPANADAVFTDRLGPALEEKWVQMYPPPPKVEPVPPPAEKDAKSTTGKAKEEPKIEDVVTPQPARISSFARGRGNVFLVSRKSGAVVWSHYKPSKNTRTKELDSTADDIVDQLHADLKVKK